MSRSIKPNTTLRRLVDEFESLCTLPSPKKFRTPEEWVKIAEGLAKKNKGILQNYTWLRTNGYMGLCSCMEIHPKMFVHIKQDTKEGRTPAENVTLAETLAKGNGDTLQNSGWLQKNGYKGLALCMWRRPKMFAHIKQFRLIGIQRTPAEHVALAEALAKKNGGILQNVKWLIKKGYSGLALCMRIRPKMFSHIPKSTKNNRVGTRTFAEWVAVAEQLSKKNGGMLQNSGWLVKNGHGGLYGCIRAYPKMFSHIPQGKKVKTPAEWVTVAEKLAKKNKEILQGGGWLQKNGYVGLNLCMRKYPKIFKHIKQDKKQNTPMEWVPIAEQLAKNNKGILQGSGWLVKNEYSGLARCMRMCPKLFAHIKQYKTFTTPAEWVTVAEELAKKNGGVLQGRGWLWKRGYAKLVDCKYVHPKLFAHIKQDKKLKTPAEWVAVAEQLAKKNGGILQGSRWLIDIGSCSGLDRCMRKYPKMFAHIKQLKLRVR